MNDQGYKKTIKCKTEGCNGSGNTKTGYTYHLKQKYCPLVWFNQKKIQTICNENHKEINAAPSNIPKSIKFLY